MRQDRGVEEESTVGFKNDLEALWTELDAREEAQNAGNPGRQIEKVVNEFAAEGHSVCASPEDSSG